MKLLVEPLVDAVLARGQRTEAISSGVGPKVKRLKKVQDRGSEFPLIPGASLGADLLAAIRRRRAGVGRDLCREELAGEQRAQEKCG